MPIIIGQILARGRPLLDQGVVRREMAHRIGGAGVAGDQKGLATAAAGSGGGATGASLPAASLPSGRPISGEPGGNTGAAAGAAAGGAEAGGCWAKTGAANRRPAIVPASKMLR